MKNTKEIKARISKLLKDSIEYESMHCDAIVRLRDKAITPSALRQCANEIDIAFIQKNKADSEIKALRWAIGE